MSTRKNTVGNYRNTSRKGKIFVLECYFQPNIKGTEYVHFFVEKKNKKKTLDLMVLSFVAPDCNYCSSETGKKFTIM